VVDFKALIKELADIEHEFEARPGYPSTLTAKFARLRNVLRTLDGQVDELETQRSIEAVTAFKTQAGEAKTIVNDLIESAEELPKKLDPPEG
jgi:hypothetical protein